MDFNMKLYVCVILVLDIYLHGIAGNGLDYCWKDYNGVVPQDAVPGGKDSNGELVYIGQVYVHNHGITVVLIHGGKKEVEVATYGYRKASRLIKILCGKNHFNFEWIQTSSATLELDTINKSPIIGGFDYHHEEGTLYIGRIKHVNELKIGPISAYCVGCSKLFYPHIDKELNTSRFEVLVYIAGLN